MRFEQMIKFNIYYLLFALLICFIYRLFNKQNNKLQLIDIIIIVGLILISALRCNVGSDYYAYYLRYNGILNSYSNIFEIIKNSSSCLFDILCFITMKITNYRFSIFWLIATILYCPLVIYLRKTSKKPYLGLMIFIFSGLFLISNNIIRQVLAMMFIFISYKYLDKKQPLKFILLIILAALFHKTALIAGLLLIIARKIKPNMQNLIILNIIGILGFILFNPIINLIDNFIPIKYLNYIINNYGSMHKQTLSVLGYVIFYNIISLILIHKQDKIKEISSTKYKMISLIMVGIPISIISIRCWPMNRIALYLYTFIIILLPLIFDNIKTSKLKIFITLILIIWFSFINIFGGDNEYYNYETYIKNPFPNYPRNVIYRSSL